MKSEFVISKIQTGQLNAAIKNIMAQVKINDPEEMVRMINANEISVSVANPKKWREENGVIYFTVTSDGTSGKEWITRLESKGFHVNNYSKSILLSKDFKPAKPTAYEIAVLKGEIFFDNERVTKNIRKEAESRNLSTPNAEVACLIREKFSDKELEDMGLHWIVIMHEPIKDSDGDSGRLGVSRGDNGSWLSAGYDSPDCERDRSDGFVFVVSQVSSF